MKKCSVCGWKYDDNAVCCGACGSSFFIESIPDLRSQEIEKSVEVVSTTGNDKKENGKGLLKLSFSFLFAILLMITIFFSLNYFGVIGRKDSSMHTTKVAIMNEELNTTAITKTQKETKLQTEAETLRLIEATDEEITDGITTIQETTNMYEGNYVVTVASENLNLRSGPGMDYPIITKMPNGTTLYISQVISGWGYAWYAGSSGWVSMEFMKLI